MRPGAAPPPACRWTDPRPWRSVINVMQPGGTILFSTNHQGFAPRLADLPVADLEEITAATIPEDYSGRKRPIHRCWHMTV